MNEFEQRSLPNANAVLILGIFSILSCWCYGVIGITMSIIALYLFKQDKVKYNNNPSIYSNYSSLNAGRILAIIGLVLSILFLVYVIAIIIYLGYDVISNPELLQERLNELQ